MGVKDVPSGEGGEELQEGWMYSVQHTSKQEGTPLSSKQGSHLAVTPFKPAVPRPVHTSLAPNPHIAA